MGRNLVRDLEQRAASSPDRLALIHEDGRQWTYAELDRAAALVGERLTDAGIPAGARVGIHLANGPELVLGLAGCWKAGLIPVAMSGLYNADEVRGCIDKTRPAALIADPAALARLGGGVRPLPVSILTDAGEQARHVAPPGGARPAPVPADDDEGLVLFTGGSTGRPKAVAVTHDGTYRSMANLARAQKTRGEPVDGLYEIVAEDVPPNLVLLPLFHGGGIQSLLFGWHVGRTILLVERFSVDRVARLVPQYAVDNLFLLPTMVYDLAHAPDRPDLTSVRKVLVAGQRLDPGLKVLFENRFGAAFAACSGAGDFLRLSTSLRLLPSG